MKKLKFLVSLITSDNDYQVEQAKAAEEVAQRLSVEPQIIYAGNDAINQSQQLLAAIQSPNNRPDAIIVEPVGGTGFPHVARAAVSAGIGWAVLNREVDYLADLGRNARVPVFCVSANHLEVGRIQGQQLAALVPQDGTVLYIQGPSTTAAARYRAMGLEQTKPPKIKLISFKGHWTEVSAYKAVASWMRLSTSRNTTIDAVVAQNDDMAMGARKAFHEQTDPEVKTRWLGVPFCGCDGLPQTGQAHVRTGLLAASVVISPNTSVAMEMLAHGLKTGTQPTDLVLTAPASFPIIEDLRSAALARPQPAA